MHSQAKGGGGGSQAGSRPCSMLHTPTPFRKDPGVTAHPGARSRGAGQATAPGPGAVTDRGASRSLRGARRPPPGPRPRRAGWATGEAAAHSLTQRGRLGIHGKRCHRHVRPSSGGHLPGFQKWRKRSSQLRPRGHRGCVTSGHALCGGCGCFRHVGRGQASWPGWRV